MWHFAHGNMLPCGICHTWPVLAPCVTISATIGWPGILPCITGNINTNMQCTTVYNSGPACSVATVTSSITYLTVKYLRMCSLAYCCSFLSYRVSIERLHQVLLSLVPVLCHGGLHFTISTWPNSNENFTCEPLYSGVLSQQSVQCLVAIAYTALLTSPSACPWPIGDITWRLLYLLFVKLIIIIIVQKFKEIIMYRYVLNIYCRWLQIWFSAITL